MAFITAVDSTSTLTLAAFDRAYVPRDVDIITSNISIASPNGNVTVQIDGSVVSFGENSASNTIALIDNTSNGNNRLYIGTTGSVRQLGGNTAVYLVGPNALVENAGSISGAYGVYFSNGIGSQLANHGTIQSEMAGVFLNSGVNAELVNTGTISGAKGILLYYASFSTISNSGSIVASAVDGYAIGFEPPESGVKLTLYNSGLITAPVKAIVGSADIDRIINTGTIIGDVLLGLGNDIYRGGGTQVGGVFGDLGTDALQGGAAQDEFYGGGDLDFLYGRGGDDLLWGDAGDDQVLGGAGDDQLSGGTGNDLLTGGYGLDRMMGDDGDDALHGQADDDNLSGGLGNDSLTGGIGADTLYGDEGNDVLNGQDDADSLSGGLGNDTLGGQAGDDSLFGDDGLDTLFGGLGQDSLNGGLGSDVLNGGAGDDTLTGAAAGDRFVFIRDNGDDLVNDFVNGTDKISLAAFGLTAAQYASVVSPAVTEAVGGVLLNFAALGGSGSALIKGLALAQVDATDFLF